MGQPCWNPASARYRDATPPSPVARPAMRDSVSHHRKGGFCHDPGRPDPAGTAPAQFHPTAGIGGGAVLASNGG
jgi:hypothetical protein